MIYEADEQLGAILLKHGLNDVSDADYKRSGKFRFGKTANSSPYVIFDYINIHVGSRSSYKSLGPRIDGDVVATMLYFLTAKKADRVAVFLKDEYDHERALTTIDVPISYL
jgi:hypothetical protein